MNEKLKRILRTVLFTASGALAGLAYYHYIGCTFGGCAVASSPVRSVLVAAVIGLLLSFVFVK